MFIPFQSFLVPIFHKLEDEWKVIEADASGVAVIHGIDDLASHGIVVPVEKGVKLIVAEGYQWALGLFDENATEDGVIQINAVTIAPAAVAEVPVEEPSKIILATS